MLKSTISKTGIFSHGLLLLVTPGLQKKADAGSSFKHAIENVTLENKKFAGDTAILPGYDSLMAVRSMLPDSIAENAPVVPLNPAAVKFVKKYLRQNNEELAMVKRKSEPYFKIIESVFRQHGLPVELKYLAVIESDLNSNARSHAGAKGPWQLMPTTARDYGLKVNRKIDERTYYYKSTVAAAKYIKGLYAELGDWLLVIAAYNGGNGTVEHAIHRSGSRNFWKLQYFLPAETRAHVKRFIGTHYFFEEKGSVTTMTKNEVAEHMKVVNEYLEKHQADASDNKEKIYTGPDNYHAGSDKAIADASPVSKKVR